MSRSKKTHMGLSHKDGQTVHDKVVKALDHILGDNQHDEISPVIDLLEEVRDVFYETSIGKYKPGYWRFWSSVDAKAQLSLLPMAHQSGAVHVGDKLLNYHCFDSLDKSDPMYRSDPFPQFKDKEFLGWFHPNDIHAL